MRHARGFLFVLLTLSPAGALRAQQPSFGPLTWEEGAPLQRISVMPTMEGADIVRPGELSADLWLGFSNIFEQDSADTHDLFLDMERLLTTVTLRWGAVERLELGGRLTFETTGGGVLDSFVLWYHELLGFGQANRDRFPSHAYEERLADGSGMLIQDAGPRTLGLEDARLFLKWRAARSADGRSVLSLKAIGRFPAQSRRVGRRSVDVALVGLARQGMGSWYLHGMVGGSIARPSPELDRVVRGGAAFFSVALERSFGSSVAGVIQYHLSSPLLHGFRHRELDGVASNLVLGLAGRWGEDWSWDVGFQEDIPADTPAIDFTLGLRVSRTWR